MDSQWGASEGDLDELESELVPKAWQGSQGQSYMGESPMGESLTSQR